jgi:glycosyltransferase involved in cell wall biosynthesis
MKINVITVTKNEGRILPFFLDHYSKFCDSIMICDGHSTDNTADVVSQYSKTKLVYLDDGNELDDLTLLDIRNNYYKQFRDQFDWQIVCDVDEFLYHPNILGVLKEFKDRGVTWPQVNGYQMISKVFPTYGVPITDQVKRGIWDTSRYPGSIRKRIIFDPQKITNINYNMGCNYAEPQGIVVPDCEAHTNGDGEYASLGTFLKDAPIKLKMLHYKYLSYEYTVNKSTFHMNRRSEHTTKNKYGFHYESLAKMSEHEYNEMVDRSEVVI